MTRFYGDDEMPASKLALWNANVKRAIEGRRGQASLRELEQTLMVLDPPRLIEGELAEFDDDGIESYCALGALLNWKGVDVFDDICGQSIGLTKVLEMTIAWVNDDPDGPDFEAPEDRYTRVLAWVRSRIKEGAGG